MTKIKALFHTPELLETIGITTLTADVNTHTGLQGRMADLLLRLYPVHDGPRDVSVVSRRISFLYGQLYELEQLNQATYDNLHEMFGPVNISSLKHLTTMIRHGKIVNADGDDEYLRETENYPLLHRLAIPTLIIQGEKNKCWTPESTQITFDLLTRQNDPKLYRRELIPGYGHIDCIFGADAARDVYPHILKHLEPAALP